MVGLQCLYKLEKYLTLSQVLELNVHPSFNLLSTEQRCVLV